MRGCANIVRSIATTKHSFFDSSPCHKNPAKSLLGRSTLFVSMLVSGYGFEFRTMNEMTAIAQARVSSSWNVLGTQPEGRGPIEIFVLGFSLSLRPVCGVHGRVLYEE
jgi:hypothetical protein